MIGCFAIFHHTEYMWLIQAKSSLQQAERKTAYDCDDVVFELWTVLEYHAKP
jgi:hypothetical protein